MKQIFKKKPEYLETVYIEDDTQSIKDVYELAGVERANVTFNTDGDRIIELDDLQIKTGMVVFKDKKSGKIIAMAKEKILQFYDEIEQTQITE